MSEQPEQFEGAEAVEDDAFWEPWYSSQQPHQVREFDQLMKKGDEIHAHGMGIALGWKPPTKG